MARPVRPLARSAGSGAEGFLIGAKADFREAAGLLAEMGDKRGEMHARQGLYECLYQTQPDSARMEMDCFVALRDSLYDMASAESLARYNAEFGNDFLREEITAERSARQRIVIGVAVGLVLLCIVFALQLWYLRRYRRKQRQRMRELMAQIENSREKRKTKASAEQNEQQKRTVQEQPQEDNRQEPLQEDERQEPLQEDERQELSAANAEFLKNTYAVIHPVDAEWPGRHSQCSLGTVHEHVAVPPQDFCRHRTDGSELHSNNPHG